MAMHEDQVHIDVRVARSLIAEQFPDWRDEPVREVVTDGTTNAVYRIGERVAARFPLLARDPQQALAELQVEARAMAEFASSCSFPTPVHLAIGRPGHGYPLPWSVQSWLDGVVATSAGLARSTAFADDLTTLICALRATDTAGRRFTGDGRGGDLRDSDEWLDLCFQNSVGLLDIDRLRPMWQRIRSLPTSGPDVMSHCDLTPANLLVDGEHLVGVLDAGGFAPADPALDLVAAWHLLDRDAREHLRSALSCPPVEWRRGAAWALQQAMGLVWYYDTSNPGMAALGRSTLQRLLDDPDL